MNRKNERNQETISLSILGLKNSAFNVFILYHNSKSIYIKLYFLQFCFGVFFTLLYCS